MDKTKNNNLIWLLVVIVIAIISFGLGYLFNERKHEIVNNSDNNSKEESNNISENTTPEDIVKTLYEGAFDYFNSPNAYCGDQDWDSKYPGDDINPNGYYASKTYSSFKELETELLKYVTKSLLTSRNFYDNYYVEDEGVLYCANLGKGGGWDNVTFEVVKAEEVSGEIVASIKEKYFSGTEVLFEEDMDLTLNKINDEWRINKYQKNIIQ